MATKLLNNIMRTNKNSILMAFVPSVKRQHFSPLSFWKHLWGTGGDDGMYYNCEKKLKGIFFHLFLNNSLSRPLLCVLIKIHRIKVLTEAVWISNSEQSPAAILSIALGGKKNVRTLFSLTTNCLQLYSLLLNAHNSTYVNIAWTAMW